MPAIGTAMFTRAELIPKLLPSSRLISNSTDTTSADTGLGRTVTRKGPPTKVEESDCCWTGRHSATGASTEKCKRRRRPMMGTSSAGVGLVVSWAPGKGMPEPGSAMPALPATADARKNSRLFIVSSPIQGIFSVPMGGSWICGRERFDTQAFPPQPPAPAFVNLPVPVGHWCGAGRLRT